VDPNVADGGTQGVDPLAASAALNKPKRRGGCLMTLGVLLVIPGLIAAVTMATMREPVVPAGTPADVLTRTALDDPNGLNSNGLLAYQKDAYSIDVSFKEKDVADESSGTLFLKSIDGDWYGTDGYVSIDGKDTGKAVPDITERGWGTSMPDHAERVVSPTLHVTLPIPADSVGTSITVVAGMRVHLPYHSGSGFSNAGADVSKQATFLVLSPEQMQLRKNLDTWKIRGSILSGALMYLAVGIALFVWGLVRRRKSVRA